MADRKYGQLFTRADLGEFVEALERLEADHATLGRYPESVIVEKAIDEMPGFRLPPAEPQFVLRAQDATAIHTLKAYRKACVEARASREHIRRIDDAIDDFADWSHDRGTKVPD